MTTNPTPAERRASLILLAERLSDLSDRINQLIREADYLPALGLMLLASSARIELEIALKDMAKDSLP